VDGGEKLSTSKRFGSYVSKAVSIPLKTILGTEDDVQPEPVTSLVTNLATKT
jgi:hypothetical protein